MVNFYYKPLVRFWDNRAKIAVFLTLFIFFWSMACFSFVSVPIQRQTGLLMVNIPIFYAAAILLLSLPSFKNQNKDWFFLGVILVYSVIALLASFFMRASLTYPIKVFSFSIGGEILVLAYLLPRILKEDDYQLLFKSTAIMMMLISLACLAVYFLKAESLFGLPLAKTGLSKVGYERHGIFDNRNYEGSYTQFMPALGLYLFLKSKEKKGYLWLACGAVCGLHLIMTFSRGAQLGAVVSALPAAFYLWKHNRALLVKISFSILAVFLTVLSFHYFAFYKYVVTLFELRDRGLYWEDSIRYLQDATHFFFGAGYLGYWPLNNRPHNGFLTQLLYFGVFGFLFFLAILGTLFKRATSGWKSFDLASKTLIAMLFGLMASDLFSDSLATALFFSGLYFWMFLGYAAVKPNSGVSHASIPRSHAKNPR